MFTHAIAGPNADASSSLNHLMLLDRKLFVSGDESPP